MTTCPDCAGPVDTALLHDPEGLVGPVTIWDCPGCQRTGFVSTAPEPRTPEPAPEPAEPVLDPVFFPGSERPPAPSRPPTAAAGHPRRR